MSQVRNSQTVDSEGTVQREKYHLAEKLLNCAGSVSSWAGLPWTDLDPGRLMESAQRATKLEDYGNGAFEEGLVRTLAESRGRFTPLGTMVLRNLLHKALENRLRVTDYLKRHPEVLNLPIRRPIIILGFPRSGTTLLQNLLAATDDRAPLEFWELISVTPVNESDPQADREARVKSLNRLLRVTEFFVPELNKIHESSATSPEEDWQLLASTFRILSFGFAYGLEEYERWLFEQADMTQAYSEFKRMLQIIQHQRPRGQLVLKCPDHLWFLDSLMEVFPDACIVQTHRDPMQCIASYTSMISLQERTLTGKIDWQALARRTTEHFLAGARRAHAVRMIHGSRRIFDVNFEDLVRDPAETVRRISGHFGLETPRQKAVQATLNQSRTDRPGAHRYSHDRLGLDPDEIQRLFSQYAVSSEVEVRAAG